MRTEDPSGFLSGNQPLVTSLPQRPYLLIGHLAFRVQVAVGGGCMCRGARGSDSAVGMSRWGGGRLLHSVVMPGAL